jgi:hypothetical protein
MTLIDFTKPGLPRLLNNAHIADSSRILSLSLGTRTPARSLQAKRVFAAACVHHGQRPQSFHCLYVSYLAQICESPSVILCSSDCTEERTAMQNAAFADIRIFVWVPSPTTQPRNHHRKADVSGLRRVWTGI